MRATAYLGRPGAMVWQAAVKPELATLPEMRRQPELALTLLRLAVGLVYAWHGFQKAFLIGYPATLAQFQAQHLPLPLLLTPLTIVLELLGGLLLMLGVGARGLAGNLALLTLIVHGWPLLRGTAWQPQLLEQLEVPFLLLLGSLAILLGGPGSVLSTSRVAPDGTKRRG